MNINEILGENIAKEMQREIDMDIMHSVIMHSVIMQIAKQKLKDYVDGNIEYDDTIEWYFTENL